jgi:CubicO group peptidase (beta-lactamase class C family)
MKTSRPLRAPFVVALLALATVAPASAQTQWDDAIARFSHRLGADVEEDGVGGIAAGIMLDGDLVWARGFGWADSGTTAMGPASILRTGSISKSVTAVLMMRLVDRGVLQLDDPVEDYLPEIPASGPIEQWEERVLESLAATRFDSVPGARYQYSNIGFGTLGLALSRVAGRPFMDLVHEEIFTPLGMTGSAFVLGELEPRLAAGFENERDGIDSAQPAAEHRGRGYKVPNGGVYSTVADLGRFMGAMSGVPGLAIVSEMGREEMLRVQTPEDPTRGYGLGFSIGIDGDGRRIVGHGGSVAGYTARISFDPDARLGVVLLRNYQRGATDLSRVADDMVRILRELGRE